MTGQKQDASKGRIKQFWIAWWGWVLLAIFLLAVVVVLAVLGLTGIIETGFGEYRPSLSSPPNPERAKTLWDWMDLLIVPLVLAIGAAIFTGVTNRREREAEDRRALSAREEANLNAAIERESQQRRAETDWAIELDRSRSHALQVYLDRMTELIEAGLRQSGPDEVKRSIARARTLVALRQLDGDRKGLLVMFLCESGLIQKDAIVELDGADLSKANLKRLRLGGSNLASASLYEADLSYAGLREANLEGAHLTGADVSFAILPLARLHGTSLNRANVRSADLRAADLGSAHLDGADLGGAMLEGADLCHSTLRGANLVHAVLTNAKLCAANLRDANLEGAYLDGADLTGANLSGAEITDEQLAQTASIRNATMPDGMVHA